MRKFWAVIVGAVFGAALGIALGFLAYPYVFAPPTATETLSPDDRTRPVGKGAFIHPDPNDPVHWGKGDVSVYENVVFLEPTFEVGPGPAYYVYLAEEANIRTSDAFKAAKKVELGKIKSFKGSQRYAIPASVDPTQYKSVIVWCRDFEVLITPADIVPAS